MKTDLEIYIEKYRIKHNISPEEAIKHKLVQEVKKFYEEKK